MTTTLALTACVWATDYTDPITLDGEWLLQPAGDTKITGAISGTGDIRYQPESATSTVEFDCMNTAKGNIYIDWGVGKFRTPLALGTGTLYVNDETVSGRNKYALFSDSMTVTNRIVLGQEESADWNRRLLVDNAADVTLTGPIDVNHSKLMVAKGKLTLTGGVTGNKMICAAARDQVIEIREKPFALTEQFVFGGLGVRAAATVVLGVPENETPLVMGFNGVTLKLDTDTPFKGEPCFVAQWHDVCTLDVNGHDLTLGSFGGNIYDGDSTFTITNTDRAKMPTVTVNQTLKSENAEALLALSGSLRFVKKGAQQLRANSISLAGGILTIDEGTLSLKPGAFPIKIADTIVMNGGVLDLCGGSCYCGRLEQRGGIIINGTVYAQKENVIYSTTTSSTIVGPAVKAAGINLLGSGAIPTVLSMPTTYKLPEGTVCYLPFDSQELLTYDYGSCGTSLHTGDGAPTFAAEGKVGGCLHVDGGSTLIADGVPAGFPVGAEPVSFSLWYKAEEGGSSRGGWFSYGSKDPGRGSSIAFSGSTGFQWYANDVDIAVWFDHVMNDGVWHQLTCTWDGQERKLYVDGKLGVSALNKPLNVGTDLFMIGRTMHDAYFTGMIDELLVVNRALSEKEVEALYAAPIERSNAPTLASFTIEAGSVTPTAESTLAINYPFNSADTLLKDASGNGANLNGYGYYAFNEDSPFEDGGSLFLDGTGYLIAPTFPKNLPTGNAVRTLACFIKPTTDCGSEGAIMSWGNEGWANGQYLNFALRDRGAKIGLFPWGAENGKISCNRDDLVSNWTSVIAIWDGMQVSIYTNGVMALAPTPYDYGVTLSTKASSFKIGKAFYDGTSYYKGKMDELAVWSRKLSASEIAAYHQGGVRAVESGLTMEGMLLDLGEDATFATPQKDQVIGGLSGAGGLLDVKSVTVEKVIAGAVTISGGLTLAEGVTLYADKGMVQAGGTVVLPENGTIILPPGLGDTREAYDAAVFKSADLRGWENLRGWQVENLPSNRTLLIEKRGDEVHVLAWRKGMTLIMM